MGRTVFVSGHLDLTEAEFAEHYAPRIREALARGDAVVVGDAPGCDEMCQKLLGEVPGSRYTVYHMLESPRRNPNGTASLVGGFKTDRERDEAMTRASDDDIAWVRPGNRKDGKSKGLSSGYGTRLNLERRREQRHQAERGARRAWPRFRVWDDWVEREVLRIDPIDRGDPDAQKPDRSVPLPQELIDRLAVAEARLSEARHEVSKLEDEVKRWRAKQEVDPV